MAGELLRKTNFLQLDQWCSSKLIGILKEKRALIFKTQTNKTRGLLVPQITSNLPSWPALRRVERNIRWRSWTRWFCGIPSYSPPVIKPKLSQSQFSVTPLCIRNLTVASWPSEMAPHCPHRHPYLPSSQFCLLSLHPKFCPD